MKLCLAFLESSIETDYIEHHTDIPDDIQDDDLIKTLRDTISSLIESNDSPRYQTLKNNFDTWLEEDIKFGRVAQLLLKNKMWISNDDYIVCFALDGKRFFIGGMDDPVRIFHWDGIENGKIAGNIVVCDTDDIGEFEWTEGNGDDRSVGNERKVETVKKEDGDSVHSDIG